MRRLDETHCLPYSGKMVGGLALFLMRRRDKAQWFLTASSGVDRIINHLKLTFIDRRESSPPHIVYQELLMAIELSAEYFS